MTDVVDKATRSRMMRGISAKDTSPELRVRKALFAEGFRYKLHDKLLPGNPDLVFPRFGAVIFVNGCFWHGHDCRLFHWPSTNKNFWKEKILNNRKRDKKNTKLLVKEGWYILTVWECALKGKNRLPFGELIKEVADWLNYQETNMEIHSK